MAVRLVSPDSKVQGRPSSPALNSSLEGHLQGQANTSIDPVTLPNIFQDLLSRFQGFKTITFRVTDWYKHAWKDMSDELSIIIETEAKNPTGDGKPVDLSSEGKIRGSVFEGMFSGVKRSVISAESLINNYCFKRRGKYSEAECKQGVGMALERMANDIWRQVAYYAQKPVSTRASEMLTSLNALQEDSESFVAKLREAQSHFEEVLKRYLTVSGLNCDSPFRNYTPEDEGSVDREERSGSDLSSADRFQGTTQVPKDLNTELREQSNRLLTSFQKFATSKTKEMGSMSARKEMDAILRDMVLMVKTSKVEAGRVKEELAAQKIERQLNRIRNRVENLCKGLDEAAVKSSPIFCPPSPPPMALSVGASIEEVNRLKDIIASQAAEIERLREGSVESGRNIAASPDSFIYRDDFEKMNETQSAIIADLRNMREMMGKLAKPQEKEEPRAPEPRHESRPEEHREDFGTTIMLKALQASAAHIEADSDSEFMQKYMDEVTDMRKGIMAVINMVNAEGFQMNRVDEVGEEFVKMRGEYLNLKDEHDELLLKVIRIQSETEIDTSYLQTRIQALEAQLEEATKVIPPPSVPQVSESPVPSQPPPPRFQHKPSAPQIDSILEEEIALLSSENFALLAKLEEAAKERDHLVEKTAELQRNLCQTEAQLDSARMGALPAGQSNYRSPMQEEQGLTGQDEPLEAAEIMEGASPPFDYSSQQIIDGQTDSKGGGDPPSLPAYASESKQTPSIPSDPQA